MKNFKEWQQQTNEMSRQEIMACGTIGSANGRQHIQKKKIFN
jgi:hypothetical protein